MSASPDHDPASSPEANSVGSSTFARGMRIGGGIVGAWFVMFVAIVFGGATSFEGSGVKRWAWLLVAAAAVLCAGVGWLVRRRRPESAIGICVGVGIGLLHAGLCFASI
jgi:hypothetical protein